MKQLFARMSLITIFITITALFAGAAYVIYIIHNPQNIITTELTSKRDTSKQDTSKLGTSKLSAQPCEQQSCGIIKAYFSPDDNVKDKLVDLIDSEKEALSVAIYTLTDKDVTNALLRARDRNITVEIVSDRGYSGERYSRIPILANHKISIWVYQTPEEYRSLMHNKFIIFEKNILDKSLVWTGSFNFTKSANMSNQENVIITDDLEVVTRFKKQFSLLKQRSLLISGTETTDRVEYTYSKSDKKSPDWSELIRWLLKGQWRRYFDHIMS